MDMEADVLRVLQTAIGPVILISGVGFLLLTMTNRMARIIDRARELSHDTVGDRAANDKQVDILWSRARMLRYAILFTSTSILSSALLVICLFIAALSRANLGWLVITLFIISMCNLIIALSLFIRDANKSLEALEIELGRGKGRKVREGLSS